MIVTHVQLIRTHKLSFQGDELSICVDKLFLRDMVRNDTDPPSCKLTVQVAAQAEHRSMFCILPPRSSSFLRLPGHRSTRGRLPDGGMTFLL